MLPTKYDKHCQIVGHDSSVSSGISEYPIAVYIATSAHGSHIVNISEYTVDTVEPQDPLQDQHIIALMVGGGN